MESHLTRHRRGSLGELWAISWPMILASAAGSMMCFVDRLILARYTTESFLANTATMPWYWFFSVSFVSLISITEVFVGQYNGAQQHEKIGPVVWQMIWVALSSWIFLIPISIWGVPYLLASNIAELGVPYLRILLLFVPFLLVGFSALGSFFVGRGKTKIIFAVLICSNLLNLVLALWFVFGWWFVPEMGIRGAAYAMGLSQVASCVAFGVIFFSKQNRALYKTHRPSFSLSVIKRCLQVGGPSALNAVMNIGGWAMIFQLLSKVLSKGQFAAYSVAHVLYGTLWFFIEGIGKGVSTIVANRIGERAFDAVGATLKSVCKLQVIFTVASFSWMVLWPEPFVKLFIPNASGEVLEQAVRLVFWSWILFGLEFIWNALYQTLVAAADTRWTMTVNTICLWVIFALPSFWFIYMRGANSVWALRFALLDLLVKIAILYWRYRCGKWKSNSLTKAHA